MRATIVAFAFLLSPLGALADSDGFTTELDGVELTYTYSEGNSYNLKYTPKGVMYRYLSGDSAEKWWGPFPYKAYKTKHGEYFLAWYEKGYGDHITQLVNLEVKTLYGSGLIVKKDRTIEHFQKARIEKVARAAGR